MQYQNLLRVASIAAVLLASSCAAPFNGADTPRADPTANFPIAVEPHFASIKVNFSAAEAGLMPDDAARFEGFVADYMSRGSGSISISAPEGAGSTAALQYFGARLAEMGVPRSKILVGTHGGPDMRVEVGFIAYQASTKPCGDWSQNAADNASNQPMANFGCSVQQNIAAQVADPRDLIEMRPSDPADAARRGVVIDNYEKGKITASEKSKDQSAAISAVGRD